MIQLTDTAKKVLEKRYLKGQTCEERFYQVCEHVAQCEVPNKRSYWTEHFYAIMSSLDFLPNSPTIMNAGRELGQLSACFVLPIEDSMDSIFQAIKDMALIQKSGGGTGFSFSKLRAAGSDVDSTAGTASGPVSFMRVFDSATNEIKQGGTRRGANMAILRVDHPDILQFINCKQKEGDLTNFNISVALTDSFLTTLKNKQRISLVDRNRNVKDVEAILIFDNLVNGAWSNGEPGVLFIDTINKFNTTPALGQFEGTNPCGEQPLLAYESCNLGSINLAHMVHIASNGDLSIDYERLEYVVRTAVRFLDNVIDVNKYPLEQISLITQGNRKIGLGIMGFADLLLMLGIPYASADGLEVAHIVSEFINRTAWETSLKIGEEKGAFPNIDFSIYKGSTMRNATRTTIAPTGTLAMIANVEYGIEPVMALSYNKTVLDGTRFKVVSKHFENALEQLSISSSSKTTILKQVQETGSCENIAELPVAFRELFKVGPEISATQHIQMQAKFQRNCDNAVSKTINFNNEATKNDIAEAILYAHQLGCKGLTVYRRGSRKEEVITTGLTIDYPIERPQRLTGITDLSTTGCGKMCITVNTYQGIPMETIIVTGGEGGCHAMAEGLGKILSTALRYGTPLNALVKKLSSVTCSNFIRRKGENGSLKGKSCPDIIGRTLGSCIGEIPIVVVEDKKCSCGGLFSYAEGCVKCTTCGNGRCIE